MSCLCELQLRHEAFQVRQSMNAEAQAWFRKAQRNLEAAGALREVDSPDGVVDRAYFAMFHAATAIGVAHGKRYPRCPGWLDAFGEAFVDTGRVVPRFLADLREAYRLRQIAVYGTSERDTVTTELADSVISMAQQFITMAEQFLKGAGGGSE